MSVEVNKSNRTLKYVYRIVIFVCKKQNNENKY